MEETIKNTFNLLKKAVLENEYIRKEDPHIYNFFAKNKPLYSETKCQRDGSFDMQNISIFIILKSEIMR